MPDDEVRLRLGDRDFAGWKTARVTVTMEAGSGSFDLQISERFPGEPTRRQIRPGARCEIRVGDDVLVTGYVDEVAIGLDGGSHTVGIRGRDAVADLIDCAPEIGSNISPTGEVQEKASGQWSNVSLLELARELALPFGIPVNADSSVASAVGQRFESIAMNPGQRVFELIEQQCQYRQVLPISDRRGGLYLTRAGAARAATPLVEGQNILAATVNFAAQECFQTYIVKGQSFDFGSRGEQAFAARGSASDAKVTRHRPFYQVADQSADTEQCQQRANWEALTRAARGARVQISVAGWHQPNGELWPVNARVAVESQTLGITGDFLIAEVSYSLPSAVTVLQLLRPDAFLAAPAVIPTAAGLEGGEGSESE